MFFNLLVLLDFEKSSLDHIHCENPSLVIPLLNLL